MDGVGVDENDTFNTEVVLDDDDDDSPSCLLVSCTWPFRHQYVFIVPRGFVADINLCFVAFNMRNMCMSVVWALILYEYFVAF